MQKQYEAPELTLIGDAEATVLGMGSTGPDLFGNTAPDFEFVED
jgi:hypothetical protein